jgi:hypothetical protein
MEQTKGNIYIIEYCFHANKGYAQHRGFYYKSASKLSNKQAKEIIQKTEKNGKITKVKVKLFK